MILSSLWEICFNHVPSSRCKELKEPLLLLFILGGVPSYTELLLLKWCCTRACPDASQHPRPSPTFLGLKSLDIWSSWGHYGKKNVVKQLSFGVTAPYEAKPHQNNTFLCCMFLFLLVIFVPVQGKSGFWRRLGWDLGKRYFFPLLHQSSPPRGGTKLLQLLPFVQQLWFEETTWVWYYLNNHFIIYNVQSLVTSTNSCSGMFLKCRIQWRLLESS